MIYIDEIIDSPIDPYKIAIREFERDITYSELKNSVYKLTTLMLLNDVRIGDSIIVFYEKSIESIIAFFSIMKVGATFIPLDISLPEERIKYIIEASQAKYIITSELFFIERMKNIKNMFLKSFIMNSFDTPNKAFKSITKGCVLWNPLIEYDDIIISNRNQSRSKNDIAYIIFTSGSTGKPKGVMIKHESFTGFTNGIINTISYYNIDSKYLSVFPFHFDASLCDIYPTLKVGGELILMKKFKFPNQLLDALEKYEITMICVPSTIINLLVSKYSSISKYKLSHLQLIWYGTESCPAKNVIELSQKLNHVKFIHSYGPTETTCTSHVYFCKNFDFNDCLQDRVFPIGKELPDVKSYALNDKMEIISPNEIGELYITGKQVMAGYCNDSQKTSEVLVASIYNKNEIAYKTGDFVTIDKDKNYIFIGRKDDMVKLNGRLIYLSEIEGVILKDKRVVNAFATTESIDGQILDVILIVVINEKTDLTIHHIKNIILYNLPSYMLPSKIYIVNEDEVPKNNVDKIDRKKLYENIKLKIQ